MTNTPTPFSYPAGDVICKGVYYSPDTPSAPLPVILIAHAWDGLVPDIQEKARKLAASGYIAFAVDIYGNGKTESDFTKLEQTLGPYMADRKRLLQRMDAAFQAALTIPGADPQRIGAMGYCFGGTAVLDLARGGNSAVKGVVSFHGRLTDNGLNQNGPIAAKILILHGDDDPLVPADQVADFKQEMNRKQADWQVHAFSGTVHSFTRPDANHPGLGAVYNARSDRRAWQAMLNFFAEVV
ncbi:MAG: dienelactone hydrolase family protein [Pseudomonadota bacterium]